MDGAEEEGVGAGNQRDVFVAERCATHQPLGRRLAGLGVHEAPLLNVLGAVAKCLVDDDLQFVGTCVGERAVHPHPAPCGELDGEQADGLTLRKAVQGVTGAGRGVDGQFTVARFEKACRGDKRRGPQPAVGIACCQDREVALCQEATDPAVEVGHGQHRSAEARRLRPHPRTALDREFALVEAFSSHQSTSNTALPATRRSSSAAAASDTSFHDDRNPICGSISPAASSATR